MGLLISLALMLFGPGRRISFVPKIPGAAKFVVRPMFAENPLCVFIPKLGAIEIFNELGLRQLGDVNFSRDKDEID